MIPLHTFNPKVLEGARVALIAEADDPHRYEWIGDSILDITPDGTLHLLRQFRPERVSLDPTDPDVARLIDRRIAEALPENRHGAVQAAVLFPLDKSDNGPCWRLSVLYGAGSCHWAVLTPPGPLDGLEPTEANLPEARARLLCALWPPDAA